MDACPTTYHTSFLLDLLWAPGKGMVMPSSGSLVATVKYFSKHPEVRANCFTPVRVGSHPDEMPRKKKRQTLPRRVTRALQSVA